MKVTVSTVEVLRAIGAKRRIRRRLAGVRLVACAFLATVAGGAQAARYEEYAVPGQATAGSSVIVGESVLVPGQTSVGDDRGSFTESIIEDNVQAGRTFTGEYCHGMAGSCGPATQCEHPGLLSALWDHHIAKVAERDAAGLPRHSTTGLVNRVLCDTHPRWTAQADALFLWQQSLDSRVLFTDAAGTPVFNAADVPSKVGIGPRAALMLHLDCTHAIEANYFNVGGLGGTGYLPATADGTTYTMNDLVGYNFSDVGDAEVTTTGAIQSFELNWRRWNTGAFTWLVGFRWVEWNENLSIVDSYVPIDPLEPGGTDSFGVLTRNDLYGAQIGTDVLLWNAHKIVRFNAVGKAGVFYNASALQQTTVTSDREPFDPISVSANGDHTAFFGEVGIIGSVKLTEWLSWRAGYNFFWLAGVAVPANQLSMTDPGATPPTTAINMNGSVLLHGANTGLEARW